MEYSQSYIISYIMQVLIDSTVCNKKLAHLSVGYLWNSVNIMKSKLLI